MSALFLHHLHSLQVQARNMKFEMRIDPSDKTTHKRQRSPSSCTKTAMKCQEDLANDAHNSMNSKGLSL
jgi:hypothetical protein